MQWEERPVMKALIDHGSGNPHDSSDAAARNASPHRSEAVRVAVASLIGTSVEWYDFFLYGTAAALVFNKLFFPQLDPLVGTIAAFATFSVGFVARPIGGIIFGHYGDRIGRKKMLYLTLWGPLTKEENKSLKDLSWREMFALLPLGVLMLWIGIAPGTFLAGRRVLWESRTRAASASTETDHSWRCDQRARPSSA